METNQDCSCGNVYVNYCCPDGNGGASFLGTKVYVDSRNTNESPDGSVNNPFTTLEQAFAYADSTDEDYIVNVINASKIPSVEYTFTKKGNLGIVGDLACNIQNIQSSQYLNLSLRFQDEESKLFVNELMANLYVFGGQEAYIDNIISLEIALYDISFGVHINNCRGQQAGSYVFLGSEKEQMTHLTNLSITNSVIGTMIINQWVYSAWAGNSYLSEISSSIDDLLLAFIIDGCYVGFLDNSKVAFGHYICLQDSVLRNVTNPEGIIIENSDMYLKSSFEVTNYTPEKNSLLSHLEALDKKIGELQAQINS